MSRRSSRLVSGGYYNSDEESDSSSVTNISYRENTVKVFKKKTGTRKTPHRAPTKAIAHASSVGPEPPAAAGRDEGLSPSPPSRQTEHTMRTVAFISTAATPRPPLTQSSGRGQTAARSPPAAAAPEKSSYAGLHLRAKRKELTQSGVDSSGYSSSEGAHRKPPGTGRTGSTSEAPSTGYWDRIRCAVFSLMDSASLMAAALQARIMHLTALAPPSVSSRLKKACGLLLLLLLLALLCVWLLPPFLTSLVSRWPVAETKPQSGPGLPAATPPPPPPPPPPQHDAIQPVVDPAVVSAAVEQRLQQLLDPTVSAAVEARMQLVLEEQREQQHALMQMERLQLEVQELKGRLAALDSGDWLRLEQEVTGLGRQMVDYRADTLSAAAVLSLRFQDLEAQNAKLSQEWSSIQLPPPPPAPAPCPDTSSPPAHLTPELQQAMEDWLSARIKEQEAFRLADGGSCSACGRPIADQMADFALETQGASVVSTRCSETFRTRSACVTLFGFPLWYPSESPRTVIQGYPVLLPGKCWAFHGVRGTLVISLSHPVSLTHVTLDHLPRFNSPTGHIDSAPKDFEVYGLKDETEEGTLLGTFTYDEHGASTQTFRLPDPGGVVYRCVELRVLSNWGHVEYTCLYRFRVHGEIAASQ